MLQNSSETVLCISIKKQWNRKLQSIIGMNSYKSRVFQWKMKPMQQVCMTKLTIGRLCDDPVFDHLLAVCDNGKVLSECCFS